MLKFPKALYIVAADYSADGAITDTYETYDRDVASAEMLDFFLKGQKSRALKIEFDVETNAPEIVSDVTLDFIEEYREWCDTEGEIEGVPFDESLFLEAMK